MRIDAIEIYRASPARPPDADDTLLVRLASGPHAGWGEVLVERAPRRRPEWSAGVIDCLASCLGPALVGQDVGTSEALQAALGQFAGNPLAKASLDLAWWDLAARRDGLPLWQKLGGQGSRVPASANIEVQPTPEALLTAIGRALAQGYGLVELETRPGWDLPMIRGVRQAFPAERLALDFRGTAQLEDRDLFYRLEDFQLAWLEQPLAANDLVGHAMLQESLRTPICLSTSIDSLARARQAAELGSCRLVRIEPSLVGGLTPALAIVAECRAAGIGCMLGADALGPLGACAALALATLPGMVQPAVHWPPAWAAHRANFELIKRLPDGLASAAAPLPSYRELVSELGVTREPGAAFEVELRAGAGLGFDPLPRNG